MTQGRVAHSYLFSGPDAIGKKTVALAFAAAVVLDAVVETVSRGGRTA